MFIKFNELSKKMRKLEIALLVLIALNLTFIFVHSMLPPKVVDREVELMKDIISAIFPSDGGVVEYTESSADKIAHFIEFGALGILTSLFISLYAIKPWILALASLLFAESVAIIDETIQIFSGRCPDIADLWTDLFGFSALSLIIYFVYFVIKYARCKKEQ